MAGIDINDVPEIAQVNIGIETGTGLGVAIESSKVTLVRDDLLV